MAHGLMDEADKKKISTLLQSGRSNSEIAYWLSRAYSGEIETLNLETGDIADYRTTAQGIEREVMDAEEKRRAMLYFRWDEVAPVSYTHLYALSVRHVPISPLFGKQHHAHLYAEAGCHFGSRIQ